MSFLSDLRYALRLLLKTPQFTLLTVLVLAGGLAISIYTYSVLNTMMYKALPIPASETMVRVLGKKDGRTALIDAFELAQLRHTRSLDGVAAYQTGRSVISELDASRSVKATFAEWSIFQFARTQPALGRGFLPEDAVSGAEPVAVIGHKIWRSVYGADPDIVDKVVEINGRATRIVGVMPKGFMFPISSEIWLPLTQRELNPTTYGVSSFNAYARLRPDVSRNEAEADLTTLLRATYENYPRREGDDALLDDIRVDTFQSAQTGPEGAFVFAVLNVVSIFILLLACVNVGNMLLARTNERIREIAVRVALGAPRTRLVLQMMMESALICVIGGVLALALAGWALSASNQFLASTFQGDLPFWWDWGLDTGAVLSALGFVCLAIFLVSVIPTWSATNISSSALLRDGTRGSQGRRSGRVSRILVIVEIVLISVVMVIGSVMAIVAYHAARIDFGIDTTNLLNMPVELTGESYNTPQKQLQFYERLIADLRHNPEIETAGVLQEVGQVRFGVDGTEYPRESDYPKATLVVASEARQPIGVRLIEGRYFDTRDNATGLKTVVVSASMAKAQWPVSGALGQRVRIMQQGVEPVDRIVIGVVSDARRGDLLKTTSSSFASLYVPLPQVPLQEAAVLIRHYGNVDAARSAIYRTVAGIDPYMAPARITSYEEVLRQLTLMATTMTDLFVRCGIFAMLLAMTGIYGLSSNAVVQRTNEIGLRRAIGARDRDIIALFLKQGARQLGVGLAISLLLSAAILLAVSRFVTVGPWVLVSIGLGVAACVSALVLVAIFIATRRAVLYEPGAALRYE
ncbi:ABC transporter permease [Xanthomonas sp. SI]|uniref:ABC transporter permease n=1 Tax=Xanthomonas sp. SI TaxID=2724123 RepID=UPI001639DA9B|nr:ABC transporter permease [Xanthomonas sp. SI]QNH11984.1 MacB-like periplasmic core domain protein [Xanthomonas sp. SI]